MRPERRSTAGRRPVGKVRPADTRRHHRALILQQLVDDGARSRADLARETSLTRVTISDLVAELIEEGFVSELGTRPGTHMGKPATLGRHLGGSAGRRSPSTCPPTASWPAAVVDLDGNILAREQVPFTRGDDLSVIADLAIRLRDATNRRILGVGIGTPGIVDLDGTVVLAPNLGWTDLDLAGELSNASACRCTPATMPTSPRSPRARSARATTAGMLLLTIGQGVGGGVMIDGRALSGPLQSAGEIGHVVVDPEGRQCACGNRGCLETFLAAPALRSSTPTPPARDVGAKLASVLTPVVTTLGIADVVLYGPAELLEGALLDAVRSALAHQTLPFVAQRVQIRLAPLRRRARAHGRGSARALPRARGGVTCRHGSTERTPRRTTRNDPKEDQP